MERLKYGIWFLLMGSIWGVVEIVGGELFYMHDIPMSSVWLTVWGMFVLGMGRAVWNRPGSSTLIGMTAALFKLVNASPHFCHLFAIFLIGLSFDIMASVLLSSEKRFLLTRSITGVLGVFMARAAFALSSTYLIRYERWVAGGVGMVAEHIFLSGSIAAGLAGMLVPVGYWIGMHVKILWQHRPRWGYVLTTAALNGLWIWGRSAA